jgi:hypothetical protein
MVALVVCADAAAANARMAAGTRIRENLDMVAPLVNWNPQDARQNPVSPRITFPRNVSHARLDCKRFHEFARVSR